MQEFKVSNIFKFLRNQTYYPKDNWKGYSFRYTVAILLASLPFLTTFLGGSSYPITIFYLLSTISVALSAWVAGFAPGVTTTFITAICIYILFYLPDKVDMYSVFEAIVFVLGGILICWIIKTAKKVNLVYQFNLTEKRYQKQINTLEQQNTQLRNEVKARDEFISIASHELKTPLTSTLLKLQTALHNVRNVSLANFSVQNLLSMLESAEQQTQRLSKMINDLLNVSLIRTGRLELELEKTDLSLIAKNVADRFTERAQKENIEIKLDAKKAAVGNFDKLRIEQALANLISNSIKYGRGKPIEIKVEKESSTAKVMVKDQGIGVPKNHKDKIFELFERAVENNSYRGLGVGLYITNKIVKAHKGKISIESKEGHGSTFTITLPVN